jgi:hypothetical protein
MFLITLDMLESDLTPNFIKHQPSFAPAFLMYSNIDTSQTKRLLAESALNLKQIFFHDCI